MTMQVSVHQVNRGVDDNPNGGQLNDPRVEILATISPGAQLHLDRFMLLIRVGEYDVFYNQHM